jgi:hypothetical protein
MVITETHFHVFEHAQGVPTHPQNLLVSKRTVMQAGSNTCLCRLICCSCPALVWIRWTALLLRIPLEPHQVGAETRMLKIHSCLCNLAFLGAAFIHTGPFVLHMHAVASGHNLCSLQGHVLECSVMKKVGWYNPKKVHSCVVCLYVQWHGSEVTWYWCVSVK